MRKAYIALVVIIVICIIFYNFSIISASTDVNDKTGQVFNLDKVFDDYVLVGLAELYHGSNKLSGNLEVITDADDFQEKVDKGRLSLYLKGKIKGKYLLTAWLDTGEEGLEGLLSNLCERDLDTPFEKIDPDKYYPVYGDNSEISSEVDTAGKFYLCLSSEEFKALWGNYGINFNKNQLISFNRSLYGFNMGYDREVSVDAFWYQPFSFHSRDELKLTGGMLYYLSHDDLVIGSDSLELELRDGRTDKVKKTISLLEGIDYEINYLPGRIILKKKVDSLVDDDLIEDESGEDSYYLLAEYDYDYDYQENDNDGYGLETAYQLVEGLSLTANYIKKQNDNGQAYQISGLNLNYSPIADSELNIDWARSENVLSGKHISDDGGLTYKEVSLTDSGAAAAWELEYQQKLGDIKFLENIKDASWGVYYSRKEEGFSSGSQLLDGDESSYGLNLSGAINGLGTDITYDKQNEDSKEADIYTIALNKDYSEKLDLKGELQHKRVKNQGNIGGIDSSTGFEEEDLTAALGFDYALNGNRRIYGSQQFTIAKSDNTERNDITKLGGEIRNGKWGVNAEGMTGSREGLFLGVSYQLNEKSEIYTKVEREFTTEEGSSTETIFGSSSKLNDKTEVYGEYRIDDKMDEIERSNVIGVDYSPVKDWLFSLDYSLSDVDRETAGDLNRKITGLGSSYYGQDLDFASRLEYRKDDSDSVNLEQFIMKGDLSWNYNQEITFLSELEYSREVETVEGKYIEGTIGLAYRSVELDRLNLIGKYTYLEEENNLDNDGEELDTYPVERSQVFAVDAIYDLTARWQLAEKIAYKNGEIKLNSADDDWTASETYLWINRLNYQWREDLGLFTEYRILENKLAGDKRSGFLLGGYKEFPRNIKLGLGYNFTDFNDDLTDLSYQAKGWFLNLIKAW